MRLNARTLRPYAPLLVLIVTVGVGWLVFVRPVAVEQARAATQVDGLRQREMVLRRELSAPAFASATTMDPAAAFERQVAAGDASPALLEHLARLASAARARNLLIETVEAGVGAGALSQAASPQTAQRDPRFALFDVPVSHTAIRLAFDTDYAGVGRFLWAFRGLPTTVEIRALSMSLPPAVPGDEALTGRTEALRVSLTLHAYSRAVPAVIQASNRVPR